MLRYIKSAYANPYDRIAERKDTVNYAEPIFGYIIRTSSFDILVYSNSSKSIISYGEKMIDTLKACVDVDDELDVEAFADVLTKTNAFPSVIGISIEGITPIEFYEEPDDDYLHLPNGEKIHVMLVRSYRYRT